MGHGSAGCGRMPRRWRRPESRPASTCACGLAGMADSAPSALPRPLERRVEVMKKGIRFFVGRQAVVLLALLGILLRAAAVQAQVSTADIIGTAFDPARAVLVGVKVTVTNSSRGFVRTRR